MKRHNRRTSCRLLPAVCISLAAAALVPSLASAGGHITWWFQRHPGAPGGFLRQEKTISGVPSIIATGEADGKRWTAVAYLEKLPFNHPPGIAQGKENVSFAILVGSLGSNPALSAGVALHGLPEPAWVKAENGHFESWMGWMDNAVWTGGPSIMTGAVADGVARLVVVSKPNRAGRRTTTQVPLQHVAAVGYGIRVFAFPLYPDNRIDTVTAYSRTGKQLQQWRNRPHPSGP